MYKYILFDLDGTLIDTSEGIIYSVKEALKRLNVEVTDMQSLKQFIGPPLKATFKQLYGMSDEQANIATATFREIYAADALYQCLPYEGIFEVLKYLKEHGHEIFVATSKPTIFAKKILEKYNLDSYFKDIVGSELDNTRSSKREVIEYIISTHQIADKQNMLMIGDKCHDLIGAQQCNIDALGVTYGYGTVEELTNEKHVAIVNAPHDISRFLGEA